MIEMMAVVAITGLLMGLSAWGFFSLKNKVTARNFIADINSALSAGKMRALSRQRNVVFVFDTTGSGAYYELDDISAAQNLNTQAALTAVATSFSPTAANYGLLPIYNTRLIGSGSSSGPTFIVNTMSWGQSGMTPIPFPYPYAGMSVDTSSGCTFCTGGKGAIAFRPDGRVVFGTAAAVAVGGALVLGDVGQVAANQISRRALFITLNGHVGSATQ